MNKDRNFTKSIFIKK